MVSGLWSELLLFHQVTLVSMCHPHRMMWCYSSLSLWNTVLFLKPEIAELVCLSYSGLLRWFQPRGKRHSWFGWGGYGIFVPGWWRFLSHSCYFTHTILSLSLEPDVLCIGNSGTVSKNFRLIDILPFNPTLNATVSSGASELWQSLKKKSSGGVRKGDCGRVFVFCLALRTVIAVHAYAFLCSVFAPKILHCILC